MKLFKWKTNFKPKFPRFVEKWFGHHIGQGSKADESVSTLPSVNIEEAEKAFEVAVALPGFNKDDVQVETQNGILTIRSEKQYSDEEREKNYVRREFGYAAFQRMFELPEDADPERVSARMKDGVLTIQVAKKHKAVPISGRIIEVH